MPIRKCSVTAGDAGIAVPGVGVAVVIEAAVVEAAAAAVVEAEEVVSSWSWDTTCDGRPRAVSVVDPRSLGSVGGMKGNGGTACGAMATGGVGCCGGDVVISMLSSEDPPPIVCSPAVPIGVPKAGAGMLV